MRNRESGVVLINVLVILALTASVVHVMISLSEQAITRSQRFSAAGQAQALISAGEASAITALRRDMVEAGQADHEGEPWALVGQTPVPIEGGSFALRIEDAQAKFNLNSLPISGALGLQILQRIVAALEMSPDVTSRIAARMSWPSWSRHCQAAPRSISAPRPRPCWQPWPAIRCRPDCWRARAPDRGFSPRTMSPMRRWSCRPARVLPAGSSG